MKCCCLPVSARCATTFFVQLPFLGSTEPSFFASLVRDLINICSESILQTLSTAVAKVKHGDRYHRKSIGSDFRELRIKANVSDDVKYDDLKDGCYTVACQAATDERHARVLGGHRAHGLQDNYVLRNPAITREACEAVRKHYGPF